MAPKSILKNKNAESSQPQASFNSKPVNPRHLEVALHHANVIQSQKEVERQVLMSIMDLLDFPSDDKADPARPSPTDALTFRKHLIPFQPSDYDALIEERNVADKCGYALCPRPRQKKARGAKKYIVDTSHGAEVVDRSKVEVWCSDDCAKRALYVKVQLSEEPAWLRRGGIGDDIELLVDNAAEHQVKLPLRLKENTPPKAERTEEAQEDEEIEAAWRLQAEAVDELARERGEKDDQAPKSNNEVIAAVIQERKMENNAPPEPPSLDGTKQSHLSIEGHVPKADLKEGKSDEEEEDDKDWDLPARTVI